MALHQQWGENDAPVTFASAEEAFSHAMALVHKGKKATSDHHHHPAGGAPSSSVPPVSASVALAVDGKPTRHGRTTFTLKTKKKPPKASAYLTGDVGDSSDDDDEDAGSDARVTPGSAPGSTDSKAALQGVAAIARPQPLQIGGEQQPALSSPDPTASAPATPSPGPYQQQQQHQQMCASSGSDGGSYRRAASWDQLPGAHDLAAHKRADGALLQLWSMHCEDALRAASARSTRRNARLDNVRSKVQSLSRPGSQSSARAPAAAQPQQQPSTSLDGSAPPPGSVSSPAPSTPDAGRARAATNEALRKSADSALLPGGGALKVSSPSSPLSQQQRPGTALASPVGLGGGRGAASSSPQAPPQRPGTSEGPRGLAAATAPLLPAARLSGSGGTAAPPPGSAALRRAYDARISTHRGYLNGVDVPDARVLQLDDATMMQVLQPPGLPAAASAGGPPAPGAGPGGGAARPHTPLEALASAPPSFPAPFLMGLPLAVLNNMTAAPSLTSMAASHMWHPTRESLSKSGRHAQAHAFADLMGINGEQRQAFLHAYQAEQEALQLQEEQQMQAQQAAAMQAYCGEEMAHLSGGGAAGVSGRARQQQRGPQPPASPALPPPRVSGGGGGGSPKVPAVQGAESWFAAGAEGSAWQVVDLKNDDSGAAAAAPASPGGGAFSGPHPLSSPTAAQASSSRPGTALGRASPMQTRRRDHAHAPAPAEPTPAHVADGASPVLRSMLRAMPRRTPTPLGGAQHDGGEVTVPEPGSALQLRSPTSPAAGRLTPTGRPRSTSTGRPAPARDKILQGWKGAPNGFDAKRLLTGTAAGEPAQGAGSRPGTAGRAPLGSSGAGPTAAALADENAPPEGRSAGSNVVTGAAATPASLLATF